MSSTLPRSSALSCGSSLQLSAMLYSHARLYSASAVFAEVRFHDSTFFLTRQAVYAVLGLAILFITAGIDYGVDLRYATFTQESRPARTSIYEGFVGARVLSGRLRVRAGAIVEFDAEEVGKRDFVSEVLAGKRSGMPRRRQSRLPVAIPVKYRLSSSGQFTEVQMTEISIGGALLATETPLPIGGELVIEVVPPGAAAALAIGGRVAYHVPSAGSTGVRFLVRDSDGSRRLRELVRRLKVS